MKVSCVDQSEVDGDCYILSVANRVILYGSILRISSLQRFLPAYFEFKDDKLADDDLSPRTLKRQKQAEKLSQLNTLLNDEVSQFSELAGCCFPTGTIPNLSLPQHQDEQL
jgi:hypothetical protein